MAEFYIENFEKFWPNYSNFIFVNDFEIILKILSSDKLQNGSHHIVWQVIHDWIKRDIVNRLTYFERLFKECIQFDYLSLHFIENNIFKSDIFKLLSSKLQKELKTFCKEILKKNLEQISVLTNDLRLKENVVDSQAILSSEKNKSSYVSNVHFFEKNDNFEHVQQEPVAKMAFLSTNVSHFVKKENNELLVCINSVNKTIEFYDPYHHKWHLSPLSLQLPNNQQYFQLSLIGSVMYAFGGKDNNNEITNKMWSRDLSDPTSQWTARASMYHSRFVFANVIINNTNYVLGGWGKSDSHLFSCERYDSQLNQWSTMTDMNSGRSAASAAVFNDCIYIAGGWSEGFERSVEKYCPQDNIWRKVAPMTIARKHFVLTPFAGRLWAIGGVAYGLDSLSSCESYDPMTDTWQKATYLNMGRWLHAAIEFNGELYVVGGNRNMLDSTAVVEKYVPTIGWVEDSQLQQSCNDPQLLIIPSAYSSFFTTDSNK